MSKTEYKKLAECKQAANHTLNWIKSEALISVVHHWSVSKIQLIDVYVWGTTSKRHGEINTGKIGGTNGALLGKLSKMAQTDLTPECYLKATILGLKREWTESVMWCHGRPHLNFIEQNVIID